ncbi:hypothetical protein HID58_042330 [Brassica napus]|uniref:Preprotein translocase subunit SECE1 n=3 Tax=Brassica TaxID=3705 RepID=A0A3N6SN91_BRACR|nr:PREDICTED: preprotein translocase subunit SECE1 [Brassica oleracea var. oleracea]XP_022571164.1 preprotein translocase subunit SECE1-like [Brassica napus]KAF2540233.1 hypothetical protein F2Q68_00030668 [Brassica cretica]KAF3533852.1 hypothetical protein DY000_02039223 [Brassica cretica]KAF3600560.1 hypothetical protein F2Q69_00034677 [Brassica cretica]KAH0902827.1 hypothetical protein HID58_042330 [Brassica napus]CAF2073402.1 unnamed protein product [Brassica napus]
MSVTAQFSPPVTGINIRLRRTASLPSTHRVSPFYTEIRTRAMICVRKSPYLVAKAIEQSRDTAGSESEQEATPSPGESGKGEKEVEISELGAEIKAAMEQRKAAEEEEGKKEFLSGVAEEVREIEWPAFQKVVGTTGVVLGVIAGSSVVLLTVNFLLAELSDRVFIGKGVQDFFS